LGGLWAKEPQFWAACGRKGATVLGGLWALGVGATVLGGLWCRGTLLKQTCAATC